MSAKGVVNSEQNGDNYDVLFTASYFALRMREVALAMMAADNPNKIATLECQLRGYRHAFQYRQAMEQAVAPSPNEAAALISRPKAR
jgi:hypothetical protein